MHQQLSTHPVARTATLIALVLAAVLVAGCGGGGDAAARRSEASPATDAADTQPKAASIQQPPDGTTIEPDGGDLPDGVYRVEFSDEHLTTRGLHGDGVANNRGVWTTTLDEGHWTVDQVAPNLTDRFEGVYQVAGDDLYWRFHDTHEVLHLTWSTDNQGDLHFTQVTDTGQYADFHVSVDRQPRR